MFSKSPCSKTTNSGALSSFTKSFLGSFPKAFLRAAFLCQVGGLLGGFFFAVSGWFHGFAVGPLRTAPRGSEDLPARAYMGFRLVEANEINTTVGASAFGLGVQIG